MSAHQEQQGRTPPFVLHVVGEVASRGEAIGLQIERIEQEPINLCIRTEDVKHLVSLLLSLGQEAKHRQAPKGNGVLPQEAITLLLDAIDVGQNHDDQTFLLLEVGITPLMVVLPPKCWEQIGQKLLLYSAECSSTRS